jgi:hypothetical protein
VIYHSVSEIYDALEATRERFLSSLVCVTEQQATFRPAPDRWTIAELVEHVGAVERGSLRLFEKMLARAEQAGLRRAPSAPFEPVSVAEHVERSRHEKYKAPEMVRPTGAVSLGDALAIMREARAALVSLRPRFEEYDCASLSFPHPVLGPLDLYQWLAFVGVHEQRHIAQIEAVKSAPGFAAAN